MAASATNLRAKGGSMLEEIAAAVRNGNADPVDLVAEALRRIEAYDGTLGAVVDLRADEALADARNHDRRGRLAGVPVLVKDLEDVAGMRTTYGSKLWADAPVATSDDSVCARMRAAGAIVVGKTNTPELGWTGVTNNLVFGSTRNPWNLEKAPGGSSGGSAAALAAGIVPAATASDGGGSVRIPASLCGLLGWKPTFGLVGRSTIPTWMVFSTNGVLATTVADAVLQASVIAGPWPGDVNSLPPGVSIEPTRPARVIYCAAPKPNGGVEPGVSASVRAAVDVLADAGMHIDEATSVWPEGTDPAMSWLIMQAAQMAEKLAPYEDRFGELDPGLRLVVALGQNVAAPAYIGAERLRYQVARHLDELMGDDGVIVTPTVNAAPWEHDGAVPHVVAGVEGSPLDAVNTMELNFTGHPAVSVPVGIDTEGVPIGMQVIAPRFRDDLAFGVASVIESAHPWPKIAPGYEEFGL
jgi:Asp-tRNA(Asn)/Glu-tRNA(Gln) amidotransferase A subunit family amidase